MRLRGFINPVKRFPALVVPIWSDDSGGFYGVFANHDNIKGIERELRPLQSTSAIHRLPDDWSDTSIAGRAPTEVSLLALSAQKVLAYPVAAEGKAVTTLLADPSFAADQPFTRLAFSKVTGSVHLVVAELLSCACHLLSLEVLSQPEGAKQRIEAWLQQERESLSLQLGETPESRVLLSYLPATLEALGTPAWWRGQLRIQPPGHRLTLAEIEDRSPSPKTVAILNLEPTVPDDRILGIMARHLVFGANYLFFHAPTAAPAALQRLRDATNKAVEAAHEKAIGPLARLAPPVVGSITFFELDKEWTGSPFVFYEEAAGTETRVAGYRGVDVGSAIARYYERLPDEMAYELLEALTSKPPTPLQFDAEHPERASLNFEAESLKRGRG